MKKSSTTRITVPAALSAIIVIVSFLPLRTLGLEITFSMVPVAVGAIVYGPAAGAILGTVFGMVSFLQCLGYSVFGAALLAINPLYTFLTCVPPRILAGLLTGLIFKSLKERANLNFSVILCSLSAALFNTLFFTGTLIICFYNTDYIQNFAKQLGTQNAAVFAVLFVGLNGLIEILSGCILAAPVSRALLKTLKKEHMR